MEKIPPEVWEQIFDNLQDSRDYQNAYKASSIWKHFLEDSKAKWMFGQAFPFLFEYLPKREILQCRRVCKLWGYGVDHFLENNAYQRPVTDEEGRPTPQVLKTDLRPSESFKKAFKAKKFDFNGTAPVAQRAVLLREAPTHSRCPIVGRSVCLFEIIGDENGSQRNREYLQVLGRHVWFLTIYAHRTAVESLLGILEFLCHVPNLKTLRINGQPAPDPIPFRPENTKNGMDALINERLSEAVDNFLQEEGGRDRLPKFEALEIFIHAASHNGFKENLLRALSTNHIQSLRSNLTINFPSVAFGNLVDLSLILSSERVFSQLVTLLNSPIRRLSLELWGHVSASTLLGTVKHFGRTLRHLELNILPDYYVDHDCILSREMLSKNMAAFADTQILADVSNLKRLVLKGCPTPSLNFLCGLGSTLEFLHLSAEYLQRDWESIATEPPVLSQLRLLRSSSKLDLQDMLEPWLVYQSNAWKLLPKLKLLTVYYCKRDIEYWRDASATRSTALGSMEDGNDFDSGSRACKYPRKS